MKNDRFSKTILLSAAAAVILPLSATAEGGDEAAFSLTTEGGKSYRGCKVLKVDPDGLTVSHAAGIAKIAFTELSEAVRKEHGYDKEKAEAFIKEHTEIVRRVAPVKISRQQPGMAVYLPNGGGYAYPYYSPYGYGYGYDSYDYVGRPKRAYPYYHGYPNVPFQLGPEPRSGSPIAPPLVSPSNFQQQQNAVQNRAGYPAPQVPVVRPQISTPNRPSAVFPRSTPGRLSRPSKVLPVKR